MEISTELFYLAEAGLARTLAHLRLAAHPGEGSAGDDGQGAAEERIPTRVSSEVLDRWVPYGRGRILVRAYPLPDRSQPFLRGATGVLLVATARMGDRYRKRLCLLSDGPPAWRILAWWEPP